MQMASRITQQQLESYLWGAATLLRGHIDAGDYKQFIFPLLFFKRVSDVYDEEFAKALKDSGGDEDFAAFRENHRFQIPPCAHWQDVRNKPKNIGKAIQDAMRDIEKANPDQLFGIFGDAQWTNTDRLPDAMLKDLVEHFSKLTLSVANVPEDELGNSYEFLIKKFADDSGHTAAEFYTNRTLVHLMTLMLDPQPNDSVYDPTCGSGGMLLNCVSELKRRRKEYRTLKLYGQELNLMTSSIARMNMFLHGIEDFKIVRGDTLSAPAFTEGDRLRQFDVVLANPPYSIKQWDRTAWSSDRYGRNFLGTPPQGRADYAFFGHILASLKKAGRCAILFPHGVLFRDEEQQMRSKLVELDQIDCVLGLGPNLFYNSPMEACVAVCRTAKPKERRGRILFINAVNEITRERAQSFLEEDHIQKILSAYREFKDVAGLAKVVAVEDIRANNANLSIPLYVRSNEGEGHSEDLKRQIPLTKFIEEWQESSKMLRSSMTKLLHTLKTQEGKQMSNSTEA
jgi:type I restriction enzyme M protein